MSKRFLKIMGILMSFACFATFLVGCGGNADKNTSDSNTEIERPEKDPKVNSVKIRFNDKDVNGVFETDIGAKTVQFTAVVKKDEEADGTVVFTSSKEDVASIDQNGLVTLKTVGETVLTAKAGDQKHEIVLVVKNELAVTKYNITVNGGKASVVTANADEFISLEAIIPEHKEFTGWSFDVDNLWVNGNLFKMPACDVNITANYIDSLYKLNIIGAKVVKANEVVDPEFEDGGNTQNGELPQFDMSKYKLAYDTEVQLKAIEAPEGMMFVGWDYGGKNNRDGNMGVDEYTFKMPDEELTVWAVFSRMSTEALGRGANGTNLNSLKGPGFGDIINGTKDGVNDPDLQGLTGYRFVFNENAITSRDVQNIEAWSSIDTVNNGTTVIKMILKNYDKKADVTVECFCSNCGNLAKSGYVTVKAGETKVCYFPVGMGFQYSWWGFNVRGIERNGSTAYTDIKLDAVFAQAPMYPDGDKSLSITGIPNYVNYDQNHVSHNNLWAGGAVGINNKNGTFTLSDLGDVYVVEPCSRGMKITNMPAIDAPNANTVYVRAINNLSFDDYYSFNIIVSKSPNPQDKVGESELIVLQKPGETKLAKVEFERDPSYTGDYYLLLYRPNPTEQSWFGHGHCITVQALFNNVIGYVEEA